MQTLTTKQTEQVSGGAFIVPTIVFIYEMIFSEMIKDALNGDLQALGELHNKPTGTRP